MKKYIDGKHMFIALFVALAASLGLMLLLSALLGASLLKPAVGISLIPIVRLLGCAAGGIACRTGSKAASAFNSLLAGGAYVTLSILIALLFYSGPVFGTSLLIDVVSVPLACTLGGIIRP